MSSIKIILITLAVVMFFEGFVVFVFGKSSRKILKKSIRNLEKIGLIEMIIALIIFVLGLILG